MSDSSFRRSLQKSKREIALKKRANEPSLFQKEQKRENERMPNPAL